MRVFAARAVRTARALGGVRRAACVTALGFFGIVIACGEVPTLAGDIAFISAVIPPSPAIALNDTLRDSTGRVAPLRVVAYDRDNNIIPGVTVSYVVTALPPGVTVSPSGIVTAKDSLGTLRLVARIGESLQTGELIIPIVPRADSIARSGTAPDTVLAFGISPTISVIVTGLQNAVRKPVQGIIVRYEIRNLFSGAAVDSTTYRLIDDGSNSLHTDPRFAVDTTGADGVAGRRLSVSGGTAGDSVRVIITAKSQRGLTLGGSPLVVSIPIR